LQNGATVGRARKYVAPPDPGFDPSATPFAVTLFARHVDTVPV